MVIHNKNALNRKTERKTKTKTVEQAVLKALKELRGGRYRIDCIPQELQREGTQASPEQIADVFNSLIIKKQIRLSRIELRSNGATVYFTVLNFKTKKTRRQKGGNRVS